MTYTFSKADIGQKCMFRDGSGYATIVHLFDEPDCNGNQVVARKQTGEYVFRRIDGVAAIMGKAANLLPPRIEADDLLRNIRTFLSEYRFMGSVRFTQEIDAYFAQQAEEKE